MLMSIRANSNTEYYLYVSDIDQYYLYGSDYNYIFPIHLLRDSIYSAIFIRNRYTIRLKSRETINNCHLLNTSQP